ncbi:MAG: AtpZ/AtpI family protein [Bacteroidota bacterium]
MQQKTGRWWSSEGATYLTMGMQLALSVIVFFFLGRWLDGMLETAPWLMIAGLAVGIVGGFIKFFTTAVSLGKRANRDAERRRREKAVED